MLSNLTSKKHNLFLFCVTNMLVIRRYSMNYKKKFFIIGLVLLVILSISAISAAENTTDVVSNDDDYEIPAVISAKDYSSVYNSGKTIPVQVKDNNGNPLEDVDVAISLNTGRFYSDFTDSNGKVYLEVFENAGSHKANIFINDEGYDAKTVKINVKVAKAPVKLTASKITSKTNKVTTLKATVKDQWGYSISQGTVKFAINGKSYKVNVKNGVATKKIRLTTAKTYNYKATFSSKNYKSKTVSSKVTVKKDTGHYYKKCGYTFRVSNSQYKKIQYVKNHKHTKSLSTYANFKVKTDKTYYGYPIYAVITTWSGIQGGNYLNYPQVQFIVTYGSPDEYDWDHLTVHYKI